MKRIMLQKLAIIFLLITTHFVNANDELGYQGRTAPNTESTSETLDRLKNDPNVEIRQNEGWTIASSRAASTLWSFTPENHPAHPSFVKREVVKENGSIFIRTTAKCGAEKLVCDQLIRDFIELNNRVRKDVSSE